MEALFWVLSFCDDCDVLEAGVFESFACYCCVLDDYFADGWKACRVLDGFV